MMADRLHTTQAELSRAKLLPSGKRMVAGMVGRFVAVYGQSLPAHSIKTMTEVWVEELADYPPDLLESAYHHIIRTHTGGWFPKPAQIVEYIQGDMQHRRDGLMVKSAPKMLVEPPPSPEDRARVDAILHEIGDSMAMPGTERWRETLTKRLPPDGTAARRGTG
jgi:hypothetical protein